MHSSNPYKPTLAVILSRFPFPLEKGDKLRAYYQLVDLAKVFDIHLICTSEKEIQKNDYEKVLKLCKTVHVFKLKKVNLFFNISAACKTVSFFAVAPEAKDENLALPAQSRFDQPDRPNSS